MAQKHHPQLPLLPRLHHRLHSRHGLHQPPGGQKRRKSTSEHVNDITKLSGTNSENASKLYRKDSFSKHYRLQQIVFPTPLLPRQNSKTMSSNSCGAWMYLWDLRREISIERLFMKEGLTALFLTKAFEWA